MQKFYEEENQNTFWSIKVKVNRSFICQLLSSLLQTIFKFFLRPQPLVVEKVRWCSLKSDNILVGRVVGWMDLRSCTPITGLALVLFWKIILYSMSFWDTWKSNYFLISEDVLLYLTGVQHSILKLLMLKNIQWQRYSIQWWWIGHYEIYCIK